MKLLFLGDIVAKPGRKTVKKLLPGVLRDHTPDLVIANAENLAGGKGVTRKTLSEMMEIGIDGFTGGNHIFSNPEGVEILEKGDVPLIRPDNFPPGAPGKGYMVLEAKNGQSVLVVSLLCRIFMPQQVDCPFRTLDSILEEVDQGSYDVSFVDLHGEATSEKQAMRWAFDGRISAMIGTHTHVPTADADISAAGTAYQSDAGMNGSLDSCIGVDKDIIIRKLRDQLPVSHEFTKTGRMQLNAVLVELEDDGKAVAIQHIRQLID